MYTRLVVLLLISFTAFAQSQSLCDKYAALLGVSDWTLVGVVVNASVASVVNNSVTQPYFNGALNPYQTTGLVNYTDPSNAGQLTSLVHSLDAFFYMALNCTDGSGQPYTGQTMKAAHANMPIGPAQFASFNQQVIAVLAQKGVSSADQTTILGVLNSLMGDICNQPACFAPASNASLCDRYAYQFKVTSYTLVDLLVGQVLTNILTSTPPSPLLRFFNGQNDSVDYTNPSNAGATAMLRGHLDQFFGMALGCSGYFPAYAGMSLYNSHKNLPIDKTAFDQFNQVVMGVISGVGVSAADQNTVYALLNSTQSQVCTLCNSTATTTTGGGSTTGAVTGTGTSTTGSTPSSTTGGKVTTSLAHVVVVPVITIVVLAIFTFLF